ELFRMGGASSGLPLDVRRRECEVAVLTTLRRSMSMVVFEDVHLYDRPSRRLLAALMGHTGDTTVLATSDQAEAVDGEVEVLRIGPLDAAAVEELAHLGLPPGVAELAGGVPLRIAEWLRARVERARDSSLEARLEALDDEARAYLEAVAVAGG